MEKRRKTTLRLTYSALCLAMAILLPFLTGNNMQLGNALSLMHVPVFLCGFLCGPIWGAAVGLVAPMLRHLIVGMPPFWVAFAMMFELCAYGFLTGLFYKIFSKKIPFIFVSLVIAMLGGRVVGGIVKFILMGLGKTEFSLTAFFTSYFFVAWPGILVHIVLVPLLVIALQKAKLVPNE